MKTVKFAKFNRSVLSAAVAAVFALGSMGLVSNAYAAEANAPATTAVVAVITITKITDLQFGQFITAPAAAVGSITVSTSGARTATAAIPLTDSTATAARFDITGGPNATYSITHSGDATLTGPGAPMALTKFSDFNAGNTTAGIPPTSGTLNGSGVQSIYVGGTLTTGASQASGAYAATITVTVDYN